MKKFIKWLLIIGGSLIVLIIVALLVIPQFVNMDQFKPEIENRITQATGRPFALKGNLDLSLFPWAGFSMTDVHLGNLPAFEEKDFIDIKDFEVRVKLWPLLFKDIEVKRFVLKQPRIVLVINKNGQSNWEGPPTQEKTKPIKKPVEKETPATQTPLSELPLKGLAVGEFAITGGNVLWIDHRSNTREEISDLTLTLENVSLDHPVDLQLSALVNKWPLNLTGNIGPLGKNIGQGTIPVDLSLKAIGQVDINLTGNITDPIGNPQYDVAVKIAPFSPRSLLSALDQTLPITTSDPDVLKEASLETKIKGTASTVSLTEGRLKLDQSELTFSATAKEFTKPDLVFNMALNQIDADRYLPPPEQSKGKGNEAKPEATGQKSKKTDYAPLRKVILDGRFKAGAIKVSNAKMENLNLTVKAKNGVFYLDPMTLDLYQGHLDAKGDVNVQQSEPQSHMALKMENIQVNPLLHDVAGKDILTGNLDGRMDIKTIGDDPEKIKKTLDGNGELLFKDGSINGFNLAAMVQNVTAAFGLSETGETKARTDFTEFRVPFTINKGVVNTTATSLVSPLLRVTAAGNADLVKETLDFRIDPKFVATLKGQGDTKSHLGIAVPVIMSGTFSSPKFRPDLQNILKQNLSGELPSTSDLKKNLENLKKANPLENTSKSLEEKAKNLLKGFSPGK